jgi:hypothetical protein
VDQCINLSSEFDTTKIPVSLYTLKSVGVDFGFSSSSTGIVVLEHIKTYNDNKHIIRVVDCHLIDPKYDKLITSLRTAYANELSLYKDQTSYNDLLDALRLSLKGYSMT